LIQPVQADPDVADAAYPAVQPHLSFAVIARHERPPSNQYRVSVALPGAFDANFPPDRLFGESIIRVTAAEFKDCAAIGAHQAPDS
jgi:hypothetical protein